MASSLTLLGRVLHNIFKMYLNYTYLKQKLHLKNFKILG